MLIEGEKSIGYNGAKVIAKIRIVTLGTSGPRVPLPEVKRKDVEDLLDELKEKILERFDS